MGDDAMVAVARHIRHFGWIEEAMQQRVQMQTLGCCLQPSDSAVDCGEVCFRC